jgi:hypothetical protein
LPNVAVTAAEAVEVSTAAAEVLAAGAFAAVGAPAAAIVVEDMATPAIAAAREWVRCTAAGGTVGWAEVRRRAALEVEEVGPRVEVLVEDGPVGAGIEGT